MRQHDLERVIVASPVHHGGRFTLKQSRLFIPARPPVHRNTATGARQIGPSARFRKTATVVSFLLSVTFACGLFIAVAHVINRRFIAPVYDVVANLTAFGCAVAASLLLGHPVPAMLSAIAVLCWLVLARRTILSLRRRRTEDTTSTP
jgi:hypothetical protein